MLFHSHLFERDIKNHHNKKITLSQLYPTDRPIGPIDKPSNEKHVVSNFFNNKFNIMKKIMYIFTFIKQKIIVIC